MSKTTLAHSLGAIAAALALMPAWRINAAECIWTGASGAWGSKSGWQDGVRPSAPGDTVAIRGAGVTVTVSDADTANFGLVTQISIEEADSRLVIDTSSQVDSPAVFSGKGTLVKLGTSLMNLVNPGSGYRALLGTLQGGIVVSNGTVQLPDRTAAAGYDNQLEVSRVEVAGQGVLSLGNTPSFSITRGLWGDGTVTNGNSGCQIYLYNTADNSNPPVFSGRLRPNVQLTPYFYNGRPGIQYMTGSATDFDISLRLYGIIGARVLGDGGAAGSLGTGAISFRGRYGRLINLNDEDERTTKQFNFISDAALATIDAGSRGGVTYAGAWCLPAYTGFGDASDPDSWKYNTIVLTGDNTERPNIITDVTMYDSAARSTVYWRKEGLGIWRFSAGSRAILGTMEVRRGTLQCETIAEKGQSCSVGLATRTGPDVSDLGNADRVSSKTPLVPYAYRLGNSTAAALSVTDGHLPTFEYVGSAPGVCRTRPFAVDGVGRILSTGGALSLGDAYAFTNGTHTLVLDGAGPADSFMSVTNGPHGDLDVVKRGKGTWHLASDIDIASASADCGTLTIGSVFTWFRWTITSNNKGAGGGWIAAFNGFALMDAGGNIVNGTLGAGGMASKNGQPERLLPGEICYQKYYSSTGSRYPSKSFHWLPDQGKFEGSDAAIDVTVRNGDSSTHPVVYFRPDAGVDVARYDILANGNAERAVAQWELAGSTDCTNWVVLHKVNADNMPGMPMAVNTWYSTMTAERGGFNIHVGIRVPSVSAAEGAVVEFIGTAAENEISEIVLDAAKGAGMIRGGRLAAAGVVNVLNAGSAAALPAYTFDGVGDFANISKWTVKRDGVLSRWYARAGAGGDGFRIFAPGFSFAVR